MAKVIITGASGFIGAYLRPALAVEQHDVISVGREFGDLVETATWNRLPMADVIIHLAGKSFVPASWSTPIPFFQANFLSTLGGLEYCRRSGAHFVFLSSYMYGHPKVLPIPESAELSALNPYALSKKCSEEACRFYAANFKVPITVLRLFNLYGRGQPESFLLPTIIAQVRRRAPIIVKDLAPRRDYIYLDDLVDAIIRIVPRPSPGWEVFNLGSGVSHSVQEVINLIQQIEGTDLPVVVDGERRPGEIMDTVADISRARECLDWQPRWSLRLGLEAILKTP